MLPGAEMDQNVLGTLEDNINIDDNIFNLNLDFGNNSVSPNDQDNCFNWVDEFISSTELEDAQESASNGSATSTSQSVNVQQITAVQQQQLLQNAVLQQQQQQAAAGSQAQQQQTHSLGNVIMAMGQPPQNVAASSASASQAQLLHNQATILPSSLAGQQLGSSFILKTSSGQHVQLTQSPVTQSTSNISASPQQFLMSRSLTPSQSSSPLLSRSMTPSHTLTSSVGQPQVSVSTPSNLNLLQLQQSQQISQQVQLSNFVAGQQNLQGHAVLAAQGSNIVHTQNALIQNPNVVNVNVAHVLPNQLPQLQGTILQTPQGKILIQPNNQQLTLSNLSQAVQMAPGVGLGQQTVIAQQPGNVNLANSGGVAQQQPSYNLINLGGSQGHVLVQRMPTSGGNVQATPTQPLGQGQIFLRTVNGQQQLLQQQPTLQPATSTTQLPQQLSSQQIPLQQFLGSGGQSLRLVGQPTTATGQQQVVVTTAGNNNNIVLQPVITANQNLRLVGQQAPMQKKGKLPQGADQRRLAMAGTKPGTVTLNLGGQNVSLQQLGLQLSQNQQQQLMLQQQQQQQQQHQQQQQQQQQQLATSATAIQQQTVVQTATQQQISATSSIKKSKSKNLATASSSAVSLGSLSAASTPVSSDSASADIMTAALMSCGILEEDGLDATRLNGGDFTDFASQVVAGSTQLVTATPTQTPTPPPPAPKSKKKSKKKKETNTVVEQPVVLSSTTAKPAITITTASASVVTTTISQSTGPLAGQAMAANTYTFSSSGTMATQSATTTTTSTQPTIGIPAVALTSPSPTTATGGVQAATLTPVRGRQGVPNTVKQIAGLQNLSAQDRQQLLQVQLAMNKLKEKGTLDDKDQATLRELDTRRKKIFNLAHLQIMAAFKQQQQQQQQQQQEQASSQTSQLKIQGQQLTLQGQTMQPSLQQQGEQSTPALTITAQQQQPPSTLSPHLKLDVKPVLGTPSTPLLQIQPKSHSKLTLFSPKQEPGSLALQDTKPLAVAGGVATSLSSSQLPSGSTYQTTAGNVIMTMSNPPNAGQAGSSQPQMLRIQIGGQKTQTAGAAVNAGTIPTAVTTQQLVLQSSQKIVMAPSVVATTVSSVMTAPPSVTSISTGLSAAVRPDIARPVQIKIAKQVLTLQLTQSQQEKLELHLSRMSLEQQQAFLQTQHHILTKLQLRAESNAAAAAAQTPAAPTTLQGPATGAGVQGVAAMAPTVVAAVAAKSESVVKNLQALGVTSNLVTASPQQLPITVQQALENNQTPVNNKQTASASASPAPAPVSRASLEIPKASIIHSQLGKDQEHAIAPDIKTPFKDYREAQRRLLRFHVFQHKNVEQELIDNFDTDYEDMCEDLIEKKDTMFAKYRHLLLEDSMRRYATSEQVLIHRMWCNDMQMLIRHDKQLAEKEPDNFVAMPMDYLEKDLTKEESEASEDDYAEEYFSDEEDDISEREDQASKTADGDKGDDAWHAYVTEGGSGDGGDDSFLLESSSPCYPYQKEEQVEVEGEGHHQLPEQGVEEEERKPFFSQEESLPKESHSSFNESFEAPSSPVSPPHPHPHPHNDSWKEASPHREPSPISRQSSSPVREHSSFHSESPRSSPPQPEPPPRTLVKLVIRNDGKGFTSKVVERRRSSKKVERRTLRSRSHSGHEREEVVRRGEKDIKKEPITEEIEYIDVDNSKYNRGVSVTLERLPDKTSQEYGLSISNKTPTGNCGSSHGGNASHRSSDGENRIRCSGSGSKSISSKSGRKRRRGEGEPGGEGEGVYVKRERHHSGFSGSSCDERGDASFRDVKVAKPTFRDSPVNVREFYVGTAMEHLDHFDSDEDGGPYLGEPDSINQRAEDSGSLEAGSGHSSSRKYVCSSPIRPVSSSRTLTHTSSHSDTHTSDRLRQAHSHPSHTGGKEIRNDSAGDDRHRQSYSQSTQEEELDFDEYIPESPIDSHAMRPPPFPGHIPAGLIQTDSMFDTSPSHEMESSFELDNPDPQGSMVNRQVQSAIDSILNGSSSSGSDGRRGRNRSRSGALPMYPSGTADDTSLDYDVGRTSHHGNGRLASEPHTSTWDEDDSEHDLDAAVQSILR